MRLSAKQIDNCYNEALLTFVYCRYSGMHLYVGLTVGLELWPFNESSLVLAIVVVRCRVYRYKYGYDRFDN